ncbi:MAG: glutamate-5-semialdehyde dehydrogenase [Chitinispirillia bacterium]|nr:glutamate-5-semialdehyde dehydrogenase [Chitinispirillia bacterium]MCL2242600.1 glutamate-5-semialdehyde dehydrogenase [Chitinispirillia bacterium]
MSEMEKVIVDIAAKGRAASLLIQNQAAESIDRALLAMAGYLESEKVRLQAENEKDLAAGREKGLQAAMLDRLTLSDKTISGMIRGLKEVAALKSPVGELYDGRIRPNGLDIRKMRVPIGVIGIIYESRPNVTVDAAAICLKSKNAVILRGGSEAFHSNSALCLLFSKALEEAGLPAAALQFIPTTDRAAVELLLQRDGEIDLIIPRGGESLIRMVVEKSRIPVIKHYKGVCHIFVSKNADMAKAVPIVINAKTQRPGVCNALETLLIDAGLDLQKKKDIVDTLINNGVTLFGDEESRKLSGKIQVVDEKCLYDEYLDLRLSIITVDGVDGAVGHINKYGSRHTDSIVTESPQEAGAFIARVDTASVMVNASTRFADGGEYGMGCEIGISTDKLHSRGPMGVEDLTTYKWVVRGNGQIRE